MYGGGFPMGWAGAGMWPSGRCANGDTIAPVLRGLE